MLLPVFLPPRSLSSTVMSPAPPCAFLLPVASALGLSCTFTGRGRLPSRPIDVLTRALSRHGVRCSSDSLPLSLSGRLSPGKFHLPGNISSQYISGLLFALPLLSRDSEIILTTPLESKPYVDLTVKALADFGVLVEEQDDGYQVPGNQRFSPQNCVVEGDYSGAAFFACGGALTGEVTTFGLDHGSLQGDREIFPLLAQMGAHGRGGGQSCACSRWAASRHRHRCFPNPGSRSPILAVTAAFCQGTTTIYNAGRLRLKESDRLAAVADCLEKLGGKVKEHADHLVITGRDSLEGGAVDGYNDHRIVMAMAIAALRCKNPVVIRGAQATQKSFGTFFEGICRTRQGNCHVIHD